jgi:dTDP-4-dehydrorhamnose 3,5-epimerase
VPVTEFDARPSRISGLSIITMKQASDGRGTVREFFRHSVLSALEPAGLSRIAQFNVTYTGHGAIRGLHGERMTKLVGVVAGTGFGAWVDARPGSATYGEVESLELQPGSQVLVPEGVLNGFQAVSEGGCEYLYGFSEEWRPGMDGIGVNVLDPALGIAWPIPVDPSDRTVLSVKDADLPMFADLPGH